MPVTQGAYISAPAAIPTRLGLALLISCAVSGCSVDIPIPGFGPADTTASIDTDASRLSPAMTAEDWSLARTALKKALETPAAAPANPAAWGNPNSGLHGVFSRDPDPKSQWLADGALKNGASCQYFIASIAGAPEPAEREGLACRDKTGQWSVRQARDRAKT
jgi:surface antigen